MKLPIIKPKAVKPVAVTMIVKITKNREKNV